MIKHQNNVSPCPSCEEKLKDAHPTLAEWFRKVVKPKFQDCHISWSFRDKVSQEQAFLDGKSDLHFPMSAHNKSDDQGNPCSLALDLFRIDRNGMGCWEYGYFRDIANDAKANSEPILWGAVWPGLGDFDHFQLDLPKGD